MAIHSLSMALMGILSTTGGLTCLYLSWKSRIKLNDLFVSIGWLLIMISGLFWTELAGWEFGLICAITIPSLIALLFVAANSTRRRQSSAHGTRLKLVAPGLRTSGRHLLRFALIVPFALIASLLISLGLGLALPISETNQYVLAVCVFPVIWAMAACWLVTTSRVTRPLYSLSLLALVGLSVTLLSTTLSTQGGI